MEVSGRLLEAKTSEAERWEGWGIRIGPEEANLWRPSEGPPGSPPVCHQVADRWLASTGWLPSGGPLEGRWRYVRRDLICLFTQNFA